MAARSSNAPSMQRPGSAANQRPPNLLERNSSGSRFDPAAGRAGPGSSGSGVSVSRYDPAKSSPGPGSSGLSSSGRYGTSDRFGAVSQEFLEPHMVLPLPLNWLTAATLSTLQTRALPIDSAPQIATVR